MAHVVPKREPCRKCNNPVFLAERLVINQNLYHRTCFRCARCNTVLSVGYFYETEKDHEYCCEQCPDEEKPAGPKVESNRLSIAQKIALFEKESSFVLKKSLSDEEKTKSLSRQSPANSSAFNSFLATQITEVKPESDEEKTFESSDEESDDDDSISDKKLTFKTTSGNSVATKELTRGKDTEAIAHVAKPHSESHEVRKQQKDIAQLVVDKQVPDDIDDIELEFDKLVEEAEKSISFDVPDVKPKVPVVKKIEEVKNVVEVKKVAMEVQKVVVEEVKVDERRAGSEIQAKEMKIEESLRQEASEEVKALVKPSQVFELKSSTPEPASNVHEASHPPTETFQTILTSEVISEKINNFEKVKEETKVDKAFGDSNAQAISVKHFEPAEVLEAEAEPPAEPLKSLESAESQKLEESIKLTYPERASEKLEEVEKLEDQKESEKLEKLKEVEKLDDSQESEKLEDSEKLEEPQNLFDPEVSAENDVTYPIDLNPFGDFEEPSRAPEPKKRPSLNPFGSCSEDEDEKENLSAKSARYSGTLPKPPRPPLPKTMTLKASKNPFGSDDEDEEQKSAVPHRTPVPTPRKPLL